MEELEEREPQLIFDINWIINECTGVGDFGDELTLIRVSLRCYLQGMTPQDAVAWACNQLSNSITKYH